MTENRRPSRSWMLVVLALLLLLVPAAIVVKRAQAPAPPEVSPAEEVDEPDPGEPAGEEVVFSPPPAAPGPAAPAEEPEPEPVKPRVDERRLAVNQIAAAATCRNLCSAQAQFQASAHADEDNDGTGEFGTFGEMSAGTPTRGCASAINPPVLSSAFKVPDRTGRVTRNGYVFAI